MDKCSKCTNEKDRKGSYCKKCYAKYMKEWRVKNREKYLISHRKSGAKYDKKMRTENRDKYNSNRRKYRTSQKSHEIYIRRKKWLMDGDVTRGDLIEIWEKSKGLCSYCKGTIGKPRFSPFDMRGFDHVVSRDNGGKNNKDNLVACCRPCNERKG